MNDVGVTTVASTTKTALSHHAHSNGSSYWVHTHTFSARPCLARSSLISLCFSEEKMIKADLKRLGASGAFLYFGGCAAEEEEAARALLAEADAMPAAMPA